MEKTVTISEKEYKRRLNVVSGISVGMGVLVAGAVLLTDKKIEKTTAYGIMTGGLLCSGISFLFSQIDKDGKPE